MATYYLSPTGNDSTGNGSAGNPWFSLLRVWNAIAAGDTVYLRGGTYQFTVSQYLQSKNGTALNKINIWGHPDDVALGNVPILTKHPSYDVSAQQDLIYMEGSHFYFKDIEVAYFSQDPGEYPWPAWRVGVGDGITFERINYHDNGAGMSFRGNSDGNLWLNCDFHRNINPYGSDPYGGADGLDVHYITSGNSNTIRGCRFFWNSDDGVDFWENNGYMLLENCWAFYNGYIVDTFDPAGNGTGIKLGATAGSFNATLLRTIRNNIAYRNYQHGIVENAAICRSDIFNNIVHTCGSHGYWFGSWGTNVATLRNNIAFNVDGDDARLSVNDVHDHNSWNGGVTVSNADWANTDASQMLNNRQPDGSLPVITFLHLAPTSDLIDAGVDVGLPFVGIAPDLGPFEYGSTGSSAPFANAGSDQSITLPTNSVTLNGSAADLDGTITGYLWTKLSGPAATIVSPTSASTSVTGLVEGTYVFNLQVTDNDDFTDDDTVTVIVNPVPEESYPFRLIQKMGIIASSKLTGSMDVLTDVDFPTVTNWQESPANTWGPVTGNTGRGRANIAITGDGWFQATYKASPFCLGMSLCLSLSNSIGTPYYDTADYAIYIGGSETYQTQELGDNVDSEIPVLNNDIMRLNRVGSTVTAEYFRGGVWTVFYTFSNNTSAPLYISSQSDDPGIPTFLVDPKQSGA